MEIIVAAHHGVYVEVFGSVSRGEDRWNSDLDLLITFDDEASNFDLERIHTELEKLLDVSVEAISRASATSRIIKDAIPLEDCYVQG